MKNHQARHTGATDVPEAHYSTNQCPKHVVRAAISHPVKGQQSQGSSKGGNRAQKCSNLAHKAPNFKNKGKAPETMDTNMCYNVVQRTIDPVFVLLPRML
ncbi:hypothetical protein ACFX2I_027913 [Malus domestica]